MVDCAYTAGCRCRSPISFQFDRRQLVPLDPHARLVVRQDELERQSPVEALVAAARRYAATRRGRISFAVGDSGSYAALPNGTLQPGKYEFFVSLGCSGNGYGTTTGSGPNAENSGEKTLRFFSVPRHAT